MAGAGSRDPIRLRPARPATLTVTLTNTGSTEVVVRAVEVIGRILGMTFFAYETEVVMPVPAGQSIIRSLTLNLRRLDDQASGLLVGGVRVLDGERRELGAQRFVVDVRGSARSVYSVFGLVVALATGVSLAVALVALARRRLHPNRWRRGLRFVAPGIGVGLALGFTMSALRVFVVGPGWWVPVVLVSAVAMFALGFFSPSTDDIDGPAPARQSEEGRSPR